jgi:hypothetical protein
MQNRIQLGSADTSWLIKPHPITHRTGARRLIKMQCDMASPPNCPPVSHLVTSRLHSPSPYPNYSLTSLFSDLLLEPCDIPSHFLLKTRGIPSHFSTFSPSTPLNQLTRSLTNNSLVGLSFVSTRLKSSTVPRRKMLQLGKAVPTRYTVGLLEVTVEDTAQCRRYRERGRREGIRLRTQCAASLTKVIRHHMPTSNGFFLAIRLQVFLAADMLQVSVPLLASFHKSSPPLLFSSV